MARSCRGLNLKHYPSIWLEGLRNITTNLSQDNRSAGRHLNPEFPVHQQTRPRLIVIIVIIRPIINFIKIIVCSWILAPFILIILIFVDDMRVWYSVHNVK
jgi:hypothetical protein